MLIDDVHIRVKAGRGGKGMVAFNNIPMHLGPSGGDGGLGGSVYAEGVTDLSALMQFRRKKEVQAENGENGKAQFNDGHNGKDEIIRVPMGTVVHDLESGVATEITEVGQQVLIARGGRGGIGNYKLRSSTNTSPYEAGEGRDGEEKEIRLELKMIADVGLIGLPNAGKSSLISALTNAKSKIGNYHFTTLEPHLGSYYGLVLADIPGLIKGAHEGKGLGDKFLRHIERTKVLFHLVAVDSEDPLADYYTIRDELAQYDPELLEKEEYVFLSKADEVPTEKIEEIRAQFAKGGIEASPLSVIDEDALSAVKKILAEMNVKHEG